MTRLEKTTEAMQARAAIKTLDLVERHTGGYGRGGILGALLGPAAPTFGAVEGEAGLGALTQQQRARIFNEEQKQRREQIRLAEQQKRKEKELNEEYKERYKALAHWSREDRAIKEVERQRNDELAITARWREKQRQKGLEAARKQIAAADNLTSYAQSYDTGGGRSANELLLANTTAGFSAMARQQNQYSNKNQQYMLQRAERQRQAALDELKKNGYSLEKIAAATIPTQVMGIM